MEREFGVGGKGVTINGNPYALWFDKEGFHIAQGDTALGSDSTVVSWLKASILTVDLLRNGMYASQDKIDNAQNNEFRELSEELWNLRQDFSEDAKTRNFLSTVSEAYQGGNFPKSTQRITELLKDAESRHEIVSELQAFNTAYKADRELLRFSGLHDPDTLLRQIEDMDKPVTEFHALEGFVPAAGTFITQDEITHLLTGGPDVSGNKLRIYDFFMQDHSAKECADFLKEAYGTGGRMYTGYDEQHDSKGIQLSRADDFTPQYYAKVLLKWNQVEKQIRTLIDNGNYLNDKEKAALSDRINLPVQETSSETQKQEQQNDPSRKEAAKSSERGTFVSPDAIYVDAFDMLDTAVKHSGIYDQLRDRETDYDTAVNLLNHEIPLLMEKIASGYPDIMEAYSSLPMFREYLVEDLLERNYQDVITDHRTAPERYSNRPDAPNWVRKDFVSAPSPAPALDSPELVLTPNVEEYLKLKAQYPDKLVGVQTDRYMLFYGRDAEEAAPALGTKLITREITGLGETAVTGSQMAWQATLKHLLEHGKSVVLARPDLERGPDAPYEIIKERDAAEYIPLGLELEMDGRRMKIDSVDYNAGTVSLQDMELKGWYPIFRSEPIPFVRQFVEEVQQTEEYIAADITSQRREAEGAPAADLETAKQLLRDFSADEYGSEEMDFSDLEHIGIAYTTTEDEKHEIQVEVNLLDSRVSQLVDGERVERRGYDSLRELIDNELTGLDFDELVRLKHDLPTEPKRVVLDGSKTTPPPVPATTEVVGRVDTGAYEVVIQKMSFSPEKHNFRITDDNLGVGGGKAKFAANLTAIELLKTLEAADRPATLEEQNTLSQYVGWGGLPQAFDESNAAWSAEYQQLRAALTDEEYAAARGSVLNAHYTSPTVIKAMYECVENMGFRTGNVLEPSMGVGNFFGLLPDSMEQSRLYGVELDSITGRIAQKLYPNARIQVTGFENTQFPNDFFDLAVGNVPFGQYKVNDPKYDKHNFHIHDYFFAKTLDLVRPGGVVAFVTSRYTMDKKNSSVRRFLAQRADLLGAVRLPNTAFRANARTEVTTDILFLQKRDRILDIEPEWVSTGQTEDGFTINQYFVEHPEMILGTLTLESRQYGNEDLTCAEIPGSDLGELLRDALANIHAEIPVFEVSPEQEVDAADILPADPDVRNFSYTLVNNRVYFRENSVMSPVETSKTGENRIRGLIEIRDAARALIDAQMANCSDAELHDLQSNLNRLYDDYTEKYGLLNSRGNSMAFSDDASYPLLCSLEDIDEQGNLKRKADIFTKRTIRQSVTPTHANTAAEALAISIGERAAVDLAFMSQLLGGKPQEEITRELQGVIFENPQTGKWENADEYLSGEVRQKLATALYYAEKEPERWTKNVESLKAVQPKDLDAGEISVRLGARWIPAEDVTRFAYETFGTPPMYRQGIRVLYSSATDTWNVTNKHGDRSSNAHLTVTFGTERINAYEILEQSLNLKEVRIFDTKINADGKEVRVLNKKETVLAQQKQQAVRSAFQDWIFREPERRERLVKFYNETFNGTRPRIYDGSHIRFVGMNPEVKLWKHQQDAIARTLYGGNTLLAHVVGAGKTYTMAAAAMESKCLGLCHKSMFVVPNHLIQQWAGEFLQLYPSANILVATKKDFETANRKRFCARIATGDYDAIIIGHSQFEKIPISAERQAMLLQKQINEIAEGIHEVKSEHGERFTIKQMEYTKKNLEAKLKSLEKSQKKDSVVTFEELGVDRLFIDEGHLYKNLFLYTKMRNVAGIGQTEAQKSTDLYNKCRYLDELTGGRGTIFGTGTPVSNSMCELYTMMRYLQHDLLERKGMAHFDCWAAAFGETVTAMELSPEGSGYRMKTRFAKFNNLPELMNLWRESTDIQTADMLNLPAPEAHYHTLVSKPTEIQKEMVKELGERAEEVRAGNVDPTRDNMLRITNDGRNLALDQRPRKSIFKEKIGKRFSRNPFEC